MSRANCWRVITFDGKLEVYNNDLEIASEKQQPSVPSKQNEAHSPSMLNTNMYLHFEDCCLSPAKSGYPGQC